MKTGVRTITYAVAEPKTYLVALLESNAVPVEFCIRMAERNRIPGLLPMHQQIDDGDVALYFDITGKRRLRDVIREAGEQQLIMLMSSLTRSLQGLSDYFLRTSQCLLEPECTFVDSQGNVYLPLVPLDEDQQDSNLLLKNYLAALLGEYAPGNGGPTPKVAAMISAVIKADFNLDSFAGVLVPDVDSSKPVRSEQVRSVASPEVPLISEAVVFRPDAPQKEKDVSSAAPVSSGAGFAIPGMNDIKIPGVVPEPPKKEKKKKEKPEKEKKTFGFLGRKKESKVDMDKEAHIVSASVVSIPNQTPFVPVQQAVRSEAGSPEQWSGTVHLAGQGATEFMSSEASSGGAALLHNGRSIALTATPYTIGRVNCNYIVDNPKVSRTHATILRDGEHYLIRDENSSNHTYINGVMIPPFTPVVLQNGTEIRLGSEEFRFVKG